MSRATETLCHRYGRPSKHALATNELVTLGYALWRFAKADLNGTRHQVNQLKIGSDGECAGNDIALTSAAFKQANLAGQAFWPRDLYRSQHGPLRAARRATMD
ncbi:MULTISPECIES: hypothetical protein [Bradyrhizobium]|uniref:Uncharacterized protein n=1 Tax=Bradyrhizobium elkanii TaxID=29448 RepID=A0A8I2C2K5_BRAEL|nr:MULTISPECIES: hypothetical protein [Bradyrhizobium]MBP1290421.1 hypothetical protein [Bradyrhizobium elkanii]MBP2428979.1 hypothetical protein [Bradyrhizobium elkanii]MCP1972188.1 hypothetical protein [Bradyrhizobium elkanii]MCS3452450.1 hypothetical protein [Bradyrhizobium elkanii]MCS3565447.1 hypothetical protein [Bradyrhizobium elkanii]